MKQELSTKIYRTLFNGNAINKRHYVNGGFEPSLLYDELMSDLEAYTHLYSMIGYELRPLDNSFIFVAIGTDENYRESAMRIQVLLEVITRQLASIPIPTEALLDFRYGVSRDQLKRIGDIDEVKDILSACKVGNDFMKAVENNLVARNLAFWNHKDGLVLSDCGLALFDDLFGAESNLEGPCTNQESS